LLSSHILLNAHMILVLHSISVANKERETNFVLFLFLFVPTSFSRPLIETLQVQNKLKKIHFHSYLNNMLNNKQPPFEINYLFTIISCFI